MANEFADVWVACQQTFDDAAKFAQPKRWLYDGVHPTPDGANVRELPSGRSSAFK